MEIFSVQPSNQYPPLVLTNTRRWVMLSKEINRNRINKTWPKLNFSFSIEDGEFSEVPDLCTVYVPGFLAFRADLAGKLFPILSEDLELLRISVDNCDWMLLNCLRTSKGYNDQTSIFVRGLNSEIVYTQHLEMTDPSLANAEVFTLIDSNRGELFALPLFKQRVESLGLKGVDFRKVGTLTTPDSKVIVPVI